MEAQEGPCEAAAEAALGTELSTVLTREGNEILKGMVGMRKCQFLCNCCFCVMLLVIHGMDLFVMYSYLVDFV